jgi:hypothetical protein
MMSFDLMVFDNKVAPKDKDGFLNWFNTLTKWEEDHSYDDVAVVNSEALRDWYIDMLVSFPALNGPDAPTDEEIDEDEDLESRLTDYCIARDAIYIAFAWSKEEEALETVTRLAKKHGLGFFDVSSGWTGA